MAATSTAKKSRTAPRMPIDDYDRLSVKAILPRLTTLSGPELAAVVAHEKAGKNRVTLLQAIRKVELAREAAGKRKAPARRPVLVEDDTMPVAVVAPPAPVAPATLEPTVSVAAPRKSELDDMHDLLDDPIDDVDPIDSFEAEDSLDAEDSFEAGDAFESPSFEADIVEVADGPDEIDDEIDGGFDRFDDWEDELEAPTPAPEVKAKSKSRSKSKTKKASAVPVEEAEDTPARSRPPVKAATWEEELRPQLPRRILDSSSYDREFSLEPPVALVAPIPSTPNDGIGDSPRTSGVTKVRRKFEGAALVMAAILAVLLGLAIGTILVRTDSVAAQPVPASVATQTASVPAGG